MQLFNRLLTLGLNTAARRHKARFDKEAEEPQRLNDAALAEILSRASATAYGRRHGFADLRDREAFRRSVPLVTYSDVQSYIERIARGEAKVLTLDPVQYLGLTSGTTGVRKMIPITGPHRRQIVSAMMTLSQGMLGHLCPASTRGGRGMLLLSATLPVRTEGGLLAGPGTSIGMASMLKMSSLFWTSPPEVYTVGAQADAQYLHLLFGLLAPDLTYVGSPFASTMLDLVRLLEHRGEDLARDLERGELDPALHIDPAARARLVRRLRPRPGAAARLREALRAGPAGLLPRVFPGVTHVSTVTSGPFAIYADRLRRYLGDLPVHSSIYGATEAVIGVGIDLSRPLYAILPRAAFFEFIPERHMDDASPPTRLLGELSVGERYEIVFTTRAGLVRYRIGDVVEVTRHYGATPVVSFLYRRGGLLNIAGEKTSEDAARAALSAALPRLGQELVDFTTIEDIDVEPQRYRFYVEALGHDRSPSEIGAALEEELGRTNPVYASTRDAGRLGPVDVRRVNAGTFAKLRDRLVHRGASPVQAKIPRVVRDAEILALLDEQTRS